MLCSADVNSTLLEMHDKYPNIDYELVTHMMLKASARSPGMNLIKVLAGTNISMMLQSHDPALEGTLD